MQKVLQLTMGIIACLMMAIGYAGTPVWTFTPDSTYPPNILLTTSDSAHIKYLITNQSNHPHTLSMTPIPGITQVRSNGSCARVFTLSSQQSCTLDLLVQGNLLRTSIIGGPVVCQKGSHLECYQPNLADALNITLIPKSNYLITSSAGVHGAITPGTPQIVKKSSSLTFTAIPTSRYQVDQWFLDDGIAQKGGSTFTLTDIDANHRVEVTFTRHGTIYASTAEGSIYFSMNNGLAWNVTTQPSPGFAINSIFSTVSTLYAGSADGKVYFTTNNGRIWNATTAVPGGTAIKGIFVVELNQVPTVYCGTEDGNVYYSTDGISWTATANPGSGAVNSLFIPSQNTLYVGSQDGNIYSSTNNGNNWTQITGPEASTGTPIQNIFATDEQLYVNTQHISSNSTLPPGTVDFEYAYTSNSLTNTNPTWNLLSQITYTLFVNADASVIYAGTQDGYVFSLITGDELGFITHSPISSLFFLG